MTDLRLIIRDIPQPSRMVALVDERGVTQTSFIVYDGGEVLEIFLFRGSPRQPWRKWARQHYPRARVVKFSRMEGSELVPKPLLSL